MEVGIIGLPNVGKSTLFNALSGFQAAASNYPYCTLEPNVAVVEVPDERLSNLAALVRPRKVTQPVLKFVDLAGLARGASRGEGLGNLFLSHIRGVDAVVHVLRCFQDSSVVHLEGEVDPARDLEIVETELLLSDLQIVDRKLDKLEKAAKGGEPHVLKERDFLRHLRETLNQGGRPAVGDHLDVELAGLLREIQLISSKPALCVANIGDDPRAEETTRCVQVVSKMAAQRHTICIPISAKLEAEIGDLSPEEGQALLKEMGFEESALKRFVRACYDLLQVITFFTIKGEETRGWTVRRGTAVREAAGKIHTDMRESFVCAEVVSYGDFVSCGGMASAREKGLLRTEGRDYVVRDGDLILIRFGK